MKHYLVYEYLRRNTDENNTASANTIAEYISGEYGISAERRSVYKDIEELNTILYMLDNDITITFSALMISQKRCVHTVSTA